MKVSVQAARTNWSSFTKRANEEYETRTTADRNTVIGFLRGFAGFELADGSDRLFLEFARRALEIVETPEEELASAEEIGAKIAQLYFEEVVHLLQFVPDDKDGQPINLGNRCTFELHSLLQS